jgi:acyl carrier protein
MNNKIKDPYEIVADVLNISKDLLTDKSALGETPNWDSLNHVALIGELENNYGIQIPNKDIEKFGTMKAIIELYKEKVILLN